MRLFYFFTVLMLIFSEKAFNQTTFDDNVGETYNLSSIPLRVRDPWILADSETKNYYLYVNNRPRIRLYQSKDLKNWSNIGDVFEAWPDFWGKDDFWAPDCFKYRGKYYLFVTFSSEVVNRGTSILVSDKPTGPFKPLTNKAITPEKWDCLDGTLFIDQAGDPWVVFSREWLEVKDGQIVAQRLSRGLKRGRGKPKILFTASDALWTGAITFKDIRGFVTDAPFLYQSKNGELLMLWSSFTGSGSYAIGVAKSKSGNILGPWVHDPMPLNNDDGGHAMIFTDFSDSLRISYHSPNSRDEHLVIYKIKEVAGKLSIVKE